VKVSDPKDKLRDSEKGDKDIELWRLNDRG